MHFIYQIGWHRVFTKFLSNLLMSVGSVVMPFSCLSFLLAICILYLFSLLSLAGDYQLYWYFSKSRPLASLIFSFIFLFPFSLSSALIFIIFFCLCWIYIILFSSSFQRWKFNFRSFIFYNKSIQCYIISFKYCFCCIPCILISCIFILNHLKLLEYFFSLTYMLFRSMYLVS